MVPLKIELPDDFFQEEERWGYTVTRQMKEVWAVELDLLHALLQVCRKHNLKIFADGGTLLGTIRHKGFIPWDDDIDLAMPRDDYDKLCLIAETEFQEPYFFQCYHTEKGYPRRHAQFRNSNTTGILTSELEKKYPFNQGIFIDIFVLDGLHEDEEKLGKQRKKAEFLQKFIRYKSNPQSKNRLLYYLCKCLPWALLVNQMDAILKEKPYAGSDYVVNYGFSFALGKNVTKRDRHYYDSIIEVPFETITIPVPERYDEWLTSRYGDYMKPSTAGNVHGGVIFSTELSYKEYFEKKERGTQ